MSPGPEANDTAAGGLPWPGKLAPDFDTALAVRPERWELACSGSLAGADSARLVQPHLLRLHAAIVEARVPVVGLRLEEVEYMNSSGLKSFMSWILAAANAPGHRYVIEITYHPARSWQTLALKPMERLAPETVRLVPGG